MQSLSVSLTDVALLDAGFGLAFTISRRRLAERLCTTASDKAKTYSEKIGFVFGDILHITLLKRADSHG
jgi:hypothetical protein